MTAKKTTRTNNTTAPSRKSILLMELVFVVAFLGVISAVGFTYYDTQVEQASADNQANTSRSTNKSPDQVKNEVPTISEANHLKLGSNALDHLENEYSLIDGTEELKNELNTIKKGKSKRNNSNARLSPTTPLAPRIGYSLRGAIIMSATTAASQTAARTIARDASRSNQKPRSRMSGELGLLRRYYSRAARRLAT